MAVDRAVLRARERGEVPPTVRLYRWIRPTVTLGRNQSLDDVDVVACRDRGFDVVRRPTGGRGVLHYSVVASLDDGIPRGVAASYRVLCGVLVEVYQSLGVPATLTGRAHGDKAAGACYLHTTSADLSFGVAKLSGSAQVWDRNAVLQHGSFVRSRDVEAEAQVFRLDDRSQARLKDSTATFGGVLGQAPTLEAITRAVCSAFDTVLGVTLQPGELTEQERAEATRDTGTFRIPEVEPSGST
ncbi:MAG: lipoate-protein ligase [Actinobacteria bacterium]|nr:MAG: lipoate-protein ligase [Actinomycetota bacterium]